MFQTLLIIASIGLHEPVYQAPCPDVWCMQRNVDFYGITRYWDSDVYAAHNYWQFKNLDKVKLKDRIMLGNERYRVIDIKTVSQYDMSVLEVPEDTIRLQTCTESMRYRLIVTAKRND